MIRYPWSVPSGRGNRPRGGRRRVRPGVEPLEERALLSVAGTLDPTFGNGGIQTTPFNSFGDGTAVAIDQSGGPTNGDIYVAGTAADPNNPRLTEFALARYLPNGQLDLTFGTNGEVLTNFGNTPIESDSAFANAVAVQRDGKIVVAGSARVESDAAPNFAGNDFAVARYTPNGSLDTNFGTQGLVVFDFTSFFGNSGGRDVINALGIDSQNRIVLGGDATHGGQVDFALARLDPLGNFDNTFAGGGRVIDNINSSQRLGQGADFLNALVIDASDNIVVAGSANDPSGGADFAVARYLPNGLHDPSFGSDGATVTVFPPPSHGGSGAGTNAVANALALGPGGLILLAGSRRVNSTNEMSIALAEYQPNGVLNPGFGAGGQTTTALNPSSANAVAFDAAGNLVLAGWTSDSTVAPSGALVFAVARYTPGGALDPTFDPNGRLPGVVTTSFFQIDDSANGLAIQPDGKIVVAGFATANPLGGASAFALARYSSQSSTVPPPGPPRHRSIKAGLVLVKVGKRRKLMLEVLDAATGALEARFLSPFQPPFRVIQVITVQGDGAGQPNELLLTARRGRHTVNFSLLV
jgi:uncharacterized delta-60 repeat protein